MAASLLPIERVRNFSKQDFEAVILHERPVIIEDVVPGWNAFGSWTADYLAGKVGDMRLRPKTSSTHIHPDFDRMTAEWNRPLVLRMLEHLGKRIMGHGRSDSQEMTFRDFVRLLTTSSEGFRYMAGAEELVIFRGGSWNEGFSALRSDYSVPSYVPEAGLDSAALWVSAKGVRSHLHYDGNGVHNLNAQISGSKHVQLYSPMQMRKIYPYLYTNGHPYTFSRVNVEDVDQRRYPLFCEVEGYEATLKAGDLLLIPAYWYHTFKHLGDFNTNINFWWRADFVRMTPVAARDYLGGLALRMVSRSRIPPFWLFGWLRKMERNITQVS